MILTLPIIQYYWSDLDALHFRFGAGWTVRERKIADERAPSTGGRRSATNDAQDLRRFGYSQQLTRTLGAFSSFAASFSALSIMTGLRVSRGEFGEDKRHHQLARKHNRPEPEEGRPAEGIADEPHLEAT
jgi:hypothetical protein